jgi:hypothetical protein
LRPLLMAKGFDPAAWRWPKGPAGQKLVPKHGLMPGKGGHR